MWIESVPIDWTNALVALVIELVLYATFRLLTPKARIIWGIGHGFTYRLKEKPGDVYVTTQNIILFNTGRGEGRDIEVMLNYRPQHYMVWPVHNYVTEESEEDGHFTIRFQSLARREHATIEMLAVGDFKIPNALRVRSPMGEAKEVPMAPLRIFPGWFIRGVMGLSALGALFLLYLLVAIVSRVL